MKCESVKDRILRNCDDRGEPLEGIDEHLAGCGECREWNEALQKAHEMMGSLEAPPLPSDFAHKVALLAQEQEHKGLGRVKSAIISLTDGFATVILGGRGGMEGFFTRSGVLLSLIVAMATGASILSSLYLRQCEAKWFLSDYVTIANRAFYDQYFWLPLTRGMSWGDGDVWTGLTACGLSFILLLAFSRVLNIRALVGALRGGDRLSPGAVILPLLGIYLAFLLWHFSMTMMSVSMNCTSFPANKAYYFYATSLSSLFLGSARPLAPLLAPLVMIFGPLSTPFLGWGLCALGLVLLVTRCSRGVPALVTYFYGCTIAAVCVQFMNERGFPLILGHVCALWSCGNSGVITFRAMGLLAILLVALAGLTIAALAMILRFDGRKGASLKIQALPSLAIMASAGILFVLFILPQGIKLQAQLDSFDSEAASARTIGKAAERDYFTVIPLKGECRHEPEKYSGGHARLNSYPRLLCDDTQYAAMATCARGAATARSYHALWFIYARGLADWDVTKLDEGFDIRLNSGIRNLSRDWYELFRDVKYILYRNGRPVDERNALMDRLSDSRRYFLSESAKAHVALIYRSLGEEKKAERLSADITSKRGREIYESGREATVECAAGTVEGRLMINGAPASHVPLRLFYNNSEIWSPYYPKLENRYFDSEEGALYYLGSTLAREQCCMNPSERSYSSPDPNLFLPLIVAHTDGEGRFRFDNLDYGGYYCALRVPGKTGAVTQKTDVGVIAITREQKNKDLGTISIDIEGRK
jgi:hypothetical protein